MLSISRPWSPIICFVYQSISSAVGQSEYTMNESSDYVTTVKLKDKVKVKT